MAIISFKSKKKRQEESAAKQSALGPVFITEKEATPATISTIISKGGTAAVVGGTPTNITTTYYTGGGGSSFTGKTAQEIAQENLERERERARQEEIKRQEELRKLQEKENLRKRDLAKIERLEQQRKISVEKLTDARVEIEREKERLNKPKTVEEALKRVREFVPVDTGTKKEVDPELQKEINKDIQAAERNIEIYSNSLVEGLQEQVNKGKISIKKANELLLKNVTEFTQKLNDTLLDKYTDYSLNINPRTVKVSPEKSKKLIDKLSSFSEKQREKSISKGEQLIKNKAELEKLLGLAKTEKLTDAEYNKIKNISRQRMNLTLQSFGTKAISSATDVALGLALLTKVPGLLANKEGRSILVSELSKLPSTVVSEIKKFGQLYRTNPEQAAAIVASDYLIMRGGGTVIKKLGKISKNTINRLKNLNPKLLKIEGELIKGLKKLPSGEKIDLKVGTIKEIKESLSDQLKRSGKRSVAVTAQAGNIPIKNLSELLSGKRVIRKPFPFDEGKLNSTTRRLLKEFDNGKLNTNQILELNKRLRNETTKLGVQKKGIDLLERSMYFDPDRTLRTSRLGTSQTSLAEGNLFDLLTGRATIFNKKPRPQILVLEELVESLPKTKEFKSIINKIKRSTILGKDPNLTKNELSRLTRFQVTPSGKLKPIGSTTFQGGLERELTLAPGEAIKKVKKLGTLLYNNQRIPIYAIKVLKGKVNINKIKVLDKLVKKIKTLNKMKNKSKNTLAKKKINKQLLKENKKLNKYQSKLKSKEIKNFLRDVRRKQTPTKKRFPLRRKILARSIPKSRLITRPVRSPRRPIRTKRVTRPVRSPRRPIRTKRVTRPVRSPRRPIRTKRVTRPVRSPRRPIRTKRVTRPIKRFSKKKQEGRKILSKPTQTYSIYANKRGKNILLKSKLSQKDARDYLAYNLDNQLFRTGFIKPMRKDNILNNIPTISKGYFSKVSKKLRPYRIKSKTKIPIKGYIEKRKYLLDTTGEKRQIQTKRKLTPTKRKELLERLKKAREVRMNNINRKLNKVKTTQTTKRKLTPSQRRKLLKRLEKARRIRMQNLKKK